MTPEALTRRIRGEALDLGFDLVGFASAAPVAEADRLAEWLAKGRHATMGWMENHFGKRVDPRELVPGCRSIVSVGLVYHVDGSGPHPPGARVARYAWGRDYHRVLKERLFALLDRGRAIDPAFDGRAFTDSAPVMDKYWAQRAGIGWRGKNTNVINKWIGSYLFLGELLVTCDLVPDEPASDHCGTCTRCIDACPTDAIVEPYVLDAGRCIAYWTIEHRGEIEPSDEPQLGDWLFGCDVCQEVCPWNAEPPDTAVPDLEPLDDAWPSTIDEVLTMGESEFVERFGDTAVERTRRRGLVRNAAIVAANTGLAGRDALERAARDEDPVVSTTATRSLDRLRSDRGIDESPC